MVFYNNVIAGASGQTTGGGDSSFKIEQSLRFDKAASAHLVRSFPTAGNRRTWTWSGWCKLSVLASSGNLFAAYGGNFSVDNFLQIYFSNASVIRIYGDNERYISDAVFRDPSAWYHIVVACDTRQSNAADRIKVYVNGVQHANQSSSPPGQNLEMGVNNNVNHYHGSYNGSSELLGGYLAEVHFIDGAQLAPTAFGGFDATTGVWNPIQFNKSASLPKHVGNWIGDFTGSGYNSSHTADKAFDRSTSTSAAPTAGGTLTFTPSPAITGITKIRIHANRDTNASSATITLNGTDISSNWNNGDNKAVEFTQNNFTSLAWTTQSNGQWFGVRTLEIYYDGAYHFLDVGDINSFHLDFDPNAGQVFSSGTLTGSINSSNPITRAFDGNTGTGTWAGSSSGFTLTFPNPITVSSSITFVGGSAQSNYKAIVNGTDHTFTFPNGSSSYTQEVTVNVSGSFTGIKGTNNYGEIRGIRVDGGPLLIDHSAPGTDASGSHNHWTGNNFDMTGSPANNTLASHSHSGHSQGAATDNFLDGQSGTAYTVVATGSNTTTTAIFTLGTTLSGTAEVLYHNGNSQVTGRISLDGGSNYTALSTTTSATWVNLGSMNSNEIRLRATFNSGGGSTAYFYGFRINGTEVVTASDLKNKDSLIDTPTPYEASSGNNPGNYCTMSPIDQQGCTLTDGNLKITTGSSKCGRGTFWANSGKWYFEVEMTSYGNPYIGISANGHLQHYVSHNSLCANNTGNIYDSNGGSQSHPGKTVAINAVGNYMVAFDLDNGKMWWGKDGTWYQQNSSANQTTTKSNVEAGNGATGFSSHPSFLSKDYWTVLLGSSTNGCSYVLNAGQSAFKYPNSIPSGYKSLCTFNLEDPPFDNPAEAIDVVTFNGGSSGGNFQIPKFSPDLVWVKNRANGSTNHVIQDALRGFADNLSIFPNLNNQEAGTGNITSVSDKTVNYGSNTNFTGSTVAWAWDAGEVANPVGDLWSPGAGKYFGVKFPTAGGGTISFGQTSGSNTVEVWSSSDNSSWTQQGGTLTLSSGHTVTTSDRYILFKNTANATMSDVYVAATNGADGHYSGSNHGPSGDGSWSGPGYTDYDFRDPGGVLNKDGNTISIVRASTTKGFSVVKWNNPSSATTVGHGLSASPHLVVTKGLGTYEWMIYHRQLGNSYRFAWNNTTNKTNTSVWQSAHPTATTFNFNDGTQMEFVAYCWTPIPGVSAMGQYEGGTSPFNYCGFRPHVVWIRNIDTGGEEFVIYDSERDPDNIAGSTLYSNSPGAEYDGTGSSYPRHIDILSNGFKATTGNPINQSATHVWVAFAESPFKYSRAR